MNDVQQLSIAIGSIGLAHREDVHEADVMKLLAGLDDYFVELGENETMPRQCVDGRPRADGTCEPAPNAAAGTFSVVVGDALTSGTYLETDSTAADHARRIYKFLLDHGYKVGGHDADHAADLGCGCGAEDKLQAILEYIRDHGDDIRTFLQPLIPLDDATHALMHQKAAELLEAHYLTTGKELRQAFYDVAGRDSVETLTGPHNEVALVINMRASSTLDRAKLRTTVGDSLQLFNVDVPSLRTAAEVISLSPEEATQKFIAVLYYNVATAAVLADTSLRIIVR